MSEEDIKADQAGSEKGDNITYLSGMYQNWFLDYASYVILERAVPYVNDGLKPVQRRILHAMREMDDGRYNKVANIIGQTMMYHPHGDASIGDALVQLGQKDLLVDTQGNWGNILTGDGSAAPRYIEARLSKFALDVVFNPKTTQWKLSYDGRNREPVTLPVKFPLLLAQGVEGIAVGLASKILPHNFIELIDASIAHLNEEEFELYPDFPTGGSVDVAKYNNGLRGGAVKVRAKIEKQDNKTLVITELPFGKTTSTLIESIIKANEKNKIKIKHIDDNTSDKVEILVHLAPGVSSDKTIDALYAFTDCEVSISPNSCIIENDKPLFLGVSDILRRNTNQTVALLKLELEIRKSELQDALHFASLEKIFIEERIYKDKEFEQAENMDEAIAHIDKRLEPWKPKLIREVAREDILKLMEIRMARILKFNTDKANDHIQSIEDEIAEINKNIENIIPFSIEYYERIKAKYGKGKERKTELRNFENIVATKVVVANEKLYVDYEEGFMGTSLRKAEYVCDCSDIDDIIVFRKDGTYFITKVSDKAFIGKNIQHLAVFKKNDKRTIYNVVYRDGKAGNYYMKRFAVTGVTRDKEYDVTQGTAGSRICYFSANPNGEAEVLKVTLKPKARLKRLMFEVDMGELAIKGRAAMGNILSKFELHKIVLKEKGVSTLGGRKIWFDHDVLRLNSDGRGKFLGEFQGDDQILVLYKNGDYQLYNFDLSNHFDQDILIIEKFDHEKVLSVVYFDAEQEFYYVKRFQIDDVQGKRVGFVGDHPNNKLVSITWVHYPRLEITFGGKNAQRENEIIEVSEFIGVKSHKARGKRLTNYEVENITELEPIVKDEDEHEIPDEEPEEVDTEDVPFEVNRKKKDDEEDDKNQMSLF
ncbi:DNA gyrase/topoisomerase IV subunit A [Mangrovibacterium diazotrophicum]|uniref:DNA topoisomerase IV subunit A n=1 Tax=Mangrovibacterium diazotrophicum TaxID=1261403 RepID=A0A419VVG7_9BACT|nr:DNA gyrase/topoisomerase IV subunit A [Mangrovibacterium diazotrophicum]RKD86154.1 DNA topoisomerase IV subunit A [Mangrovibacterium diazotrophicum]